MASRLVALGDSTVEGLMDPGPDGSHVGSAPWGHEFATGGACKRPDLLPVND